MSKIICDICGTSYPETEDVCPVCGCAKDMTAEELLGDYLNEEIQEPAEEETKAAVFAAAATEKEVSRDDDEEYDEDDDEYDDDEDDEDEDDEEEEKSNTPLVILLVIVIVALLAVTGFIFVKYFLPNMQPVETVPPTTQAIVTEQKDTTAPAVPCTSLVLTSGTEFTLEEVGFSWLIHVSALPENTTEEITFTSSNEEVAVVGADGTVTAVGEGTAIITVACGSQQIDCTVVCAFAPETSATTEPETTAETTVPETTVPETSVPETTLPDVTISFVKSDVTSRMLGEQFPLKINPSTLDPKLITWSSENERICVVDETGLVTIKGRGTTHVIAEYNGQKIECIVRVV